MKKLGLVTLNGFELIPLSDIIYCSSFRNYTYFHLIRNRQVCISKSLIEFEKILENEQFLRIHKSFLINISHIKEYKNNEGGLVIMSNNDELIVSRRNKERFFHEVKKQFLFT